MPQASDHEKHVAKSWLRFRIGFGLGLLVAAYIIFA